MSLLANLGNWFRQIGGALKNLFVSAVDTETGIFDAYFSMKDDVDAFVSNLHGFQHFEIDPKWASRVITVPRAIDGINELFDIVFHQLHDKFQQFAHELQTVVNVIEQQGKQPPEEGAGGIANVQANLATFKLAATNLKDAFHTALAIEQMLLDVKQRLESFDDLFLPQGSSKTTGDFHYRKRNA